MILNIIGSGSTSDVFARLIACVLALLIAMILHEFAHAYVAVKCGDPTPKVMGRLSVNPMRHLDPIGTLMLLIIGFGYAKPVPINPNNFRNYKKGMFFTSIAGVLTNLVLAFFGSLLFLVTATFVTGSDFGSTLLVGFFLYFTVYNISLFLFNLIPIYPLDGFNMIFAFSKNKERMLRFSRQYGMILLLIVMLVGGYFFTDTVVYIAMKMCKLWDLIFGKVL